MNRKTEIVAGLTTFLAMSYIILVNPATLAAEGTGMNFNGVLTATVMLSFLMTLAMGIYAKLPYAVAPGMGINAFFTYTLVLGDKIPWQTALGMVFWSGVLFLVISLTPLREKLALALPKSLKIGCAVGIGIFLAFIGLRNSNLIVMSPSTFVRMGKLNGQSLLSILGLITILVLMRRKNPLASLAGILLVTALSLIFGYTKLPDVYFLPPDFHSVFFQLDIWGALKVSLVPVVVSLVFTDLFDSISTFVGVSRAGGLIDKAGNPLRLKEGLIVDAFATLTAGLFGTSAGTAYMESAAGVEAGGRTGLTAVVAALLFLPFLFLAPLAGMVPGAATAPVLICVGMLMFKNVLELKMNDLEDWVPGVVTIIFIPLTFSITRGLMWGIAIHVIMFALVGRFREIGIVMWILGLLSAFYLGFN